MVDGVKNLVRLIQKARAEMSTQPSRFLLSNVNISDREIAETAIF